MYVKEAITFQPIQYFSTIISSRAFEVPSKNKISKIYFQLNVSLAKETKRTRPVTK